MSERVVRVWAQASMALLLIVLVVFLLFVFSR
jgi:hypothetical protein